jgi:hypothetical protein
MATKAAKRNAWSAFESDDEDGAGPSVAPVQKVGGMTLAEIEERIVRRRFWPFPTEAEESNPSAWPCRSCCPWQCDEGAFWECEHGKWLWVDSWASVPPQTEDHTLEECRGGSCPGHGLYSGGILALHLACQAGIGWGDVVCLDEAEAEAALTPEQRAQKALAKAREEARRQRDMAEAEARKASELVALRPAVQQEHRRYDRRTGKPMPCQYYCYQGVLGREHPAENGWAAGCGYHKKGKCPFFHPDEPEWQVIIGATPMPSRPATPEPEWRSAGGAGGPRSGGGTAFSSPRPGSGGGGSYRGGGGGGGSRASGSGAPRREY